VHADPTPFIKKVTFFVSQNAAAAVMYNDHAYEKWE
jgi:hypothetical protein